MALAMFLCFPLALWCVQAISAGACETSNATCNRQENADVNAEVASLLQVPTARQKKLQSTVRSSSLPSCPLVTVVGQGNYVPGGSLDPRVIPKYETPLVIPPVMANDGKTSQYDIAVRKFQQQILPGGIWNNAVFSTRNCSYNFAATTVFGYGPTTDQDPDSSSLGGGVGIAPAPNSQFNYPGYTVENFKDVKTKVTWANQLMKNPCKCSTQRQCRQQSQLLEVQQLHLFQSVETINSTSKWAPDDCEYVPHLFAIDRSLNWANPERLPCDPPVTSLRQAQIKISDGRRRPEKDKRSRRRVPDKGSDGPRNQDCMPDPMRNGVLLQEPYLGPIPIVTHVHGGHTQPESDGFPSAWYLPAASNIPKYYATQGTLVNKYGSDRKTNFAEGEARFSYQNDQPTATIWYHDHAFGLTRNNVYAGLAGFWLIREANGSETGLVSGVLPGPAPKLGETLQDTNLPPGRNKYREIPLAIQDRSFNSDASLFFPAERAFNEQPRTLNIPYVGDATHPSDIPQIWVPEAFFNVMVVNGVAWPVLKVERALYRFRLLNGCTARFLNLALYVFDQNGNRQQEVPLYQIGGDQGLLPNVVKITTGSKTPLPGNGTTPSPGAAPTFEALLLGPGQRADVLVDFSRSGLEPGYVVRMINTAPDQPYLGTLNDPQVGAPDVADPETTGQVMQFVVTASAGPDPATPPENLKLASIDSNDPAADPNSQPAALRDLALAELDSANICVKETTQSINFDSAAVPSAQNPRTCVDSNGATVLGSSPYGPKVVVLGINGSQSRNGGGFGGAVTFFSSPIVTNPALGSTEEWEFWNWTPDAHTIHLHEVKFKVFNRQSFNTANGSLVGIPEAPNPTELGWSDTVITNPGQVTRIKATFDIPGLYVWHCHILTHEDNEMMVPFCIGDAHSAPGCNVLPGR
jgi:spore coat protein A, manganese oxidase